MKPHKGAIFLYNEAEASASNAGPGSGSTCIFSFLGRINSIKSINNDIKQIYMPDPEPGSEQENAIYRGLDLYRRAYMLYIIYKYISKRKCCNEF